MMTGDRYAKLPRHVAIIMDGNGRWAERRGLPRARGHRQGVETVRDIARCARDMGVEYLTLFSFSTENWARPKTEIGELFTLLKLFVKRDLAELHHNNCRVRIIGERNGLPDDILPLLLDAEKLTAGNTGQTLVIAFNYGSRNEIVRAAARLAQMAVNGEIDPDAIDQTAFESQLETAGIPDPDLVIRTSGEHRLSNFLLWQAAYAEYVFPETLWPDFTETEFRAAIEQFCSRDRRFGGLAEEPGSLDTGS